MSETGIVNENGIIPESVLWGCIQAILFIIIIEDR